MQVGAWLLGCLRVTGRVSGTKWIRGPAPYKMHAAAQSTRPLMALVVCRLSSPFFLAGFWALQNFARPLRLSLALALAPAFDRAITGIGEKLRVSKGAAFGVSGWLLVGGRVV